MRRHIGWIAGVSLLVLTSASASADWQFTKWGMSKSEVIRASKNAAVQTAAAGTLEMPYVSGNFTFDADFDFDAHSKLFDVFLILRSGGNRALLAALKAKYGEPVEQDGASLYWRTKTDEIMYTAGSSDGSDADVKYRPRANANNSGL